MNCKICEHPVSEYGKGIYYLEDGKKFLTPFFYCPKCTVLIRDTDSKSVVAHLKGASHTNISNEESYYKSRIGYYRYIHQIADRLLPSPSTWLDFGCSYGHLIAYLMTRNIDAEGVEINEGVRIFAQSKGLRISESTGALAEGKMFDVISMIDSLYYSTEPASLMMEIYDRLQKDGLLIVRVTNRNWLAKLRKSVLRKDFGEILGDATISYSRKSISVLLRNNGFEIINITGFEKGKSAGFFTKVFYALTSVISRISGGSIDISPGLIVLAKKA